MHPNLTVEQGCSIEYPHYSICVISGGAGDTFGGNIVGESDLTISALNRP